MMIGFQTNVKDGKDFSLYVEKYCGGQTESFTSPEGIAIIYDEEQDKMITTGCMSTEHLEKAMEHIWRALMESYKQKHEDNVLEFTLDCCKILDGLDDMVNVEVDENGSMDGVSQK